MLDRNKPYATVHGGGAARFIQDGRNFDGQGFELDASLQGVGQPKQPPEAEPIVTQAPPTVTVTVTPGPEVLVDSKPADEAPRTRLRLKR